MERWDLSRSAGTGVQLSPGGVGDHFGEVEALAQLLAQVVELARRRAAGSVLEDQKS